MDSNNNPSTKVDVYRIVTDRIIALLEQGIVPWQQPWTNAGIPMNLLSKRPYRGINLWLLLSLNYERNLFLTWDQLKKAGGSVKQGQHGHVVVFWKTVAKTNRTDENEITKDVPMLRYYKVFNVEQCRNIPDELFAKVGSSIPSAPQITEGKYDPIPECEAIIHGMPGCPPIKHKEQQAYYAIELDYINMPKKKSFKSNESYYTVLFHELVHSTGHEKRLNRKSVKEMAEFGSESYSIEELIAELGSSYLSALSGILNSAIANSAAYIDGWLTKLKSDKKFILHASGFAQRAVDFILNHRLESPDANEQVEQSELLT